MRVFTKGTLQRFWERHPDAAGPLLSWYKNAERADWNTPSDLLATSANVRILRSNRAIFNINGNDYRLVVRIDYQLKRVYVRFVGTHAEYDRINALEV